MSISSDYSSIYGSSSVGFAALGTGIMVFLSLFMIIILAISVIMIISMWKIFEKNGKNGWISLIPFYSQWVLFELVEIPGWLIFVPFANSVFAIIANYKIALKMEKSQGIAILNAIVPAVGYPIIAFGKDKKNSSENKTVSEKINNNDIMTEVTNDDNVTYQNINNNNDINE